MLGDPATRDGEDSRHISVEKRKKAFSDAASEYFSLLSIVDVNLRRQIMALEEANIIPKGGSRDKTSQSQGQEVSEVGSVAGALGNLDVGWLNSRNDKIGKETEAELWTEARELVDELVRSSTKSENDHE